MIYVNDLKFNLYFGIEIWYGDKSRISPVPKARYYLNSLNYLHREGGPAIIFHDGSEVWCVDGLLHREDGPALTYPLGGNKWYLNGNRIPENEFISIVRNQKLLNLLKQ